MLMRREMRMISSLSMPMTGRNTGRSMAPPVHCMASMVWLATCPRLSPVTSAPAPVRASGTSAGTLIGLDKRYALEQVVGGEVMVEYDKLIDRQLERAAITSISGFAKLFTGASKAMNLGAEVQG